MTFREFTGKNVEEAIRAAMAEFSSDLGDLDIEILAQGSRGILGVGGEEARILAAPKSAVAAADTVRPERAPEPTRARRPAREPEPEPEPEVETMTVADAEADEASPAEAQADASRHLAPLRRQPVDQDRDEDDVVDAEHQLERRQHQERDPGLRIEEQLHPPSVQSPAAHGAPWIR